MQQTPFQLGKLRYHSRDLEELRVKRTKKCYDKWKTTTRAAKPMSKHELNSFQVIQVNMSGLLHLHTANAGLDFKCVSSSPIFFIRFFRGEQLKDRPVRTFCTESSWRQSRTNFYHPAVENNARQWLKMNYGKLFDSNCCLIIQNNPHSQALCFVNICDCVLPTNDSSFDNERLLWLFRIHDEMCLGISFFVLCASFPLVDTRLYSRFNNGTCRLVVVQFSLEFDDLG